MDIQQAQNAADSAAATAVTSAVAGFTIAEANEWMQFFAFAVAIFSGAAAGWWHVKKILAQSRVDKLRDPEEVERILKERDRS